MGTFRVVAVLALFCVACCSRPPTELELRRELADGVIRSGPAGHKVIALSFDDGPKPEWTPRLLEALDVLGVKATFFLVGAQCKQFPDLVKAISQAGHCIANHSYSHPNLTKLSPDEVYRQLSDTNELLVSLTGKRVRYFRPPGGNYNDGVVEQARKAGLVMVLWTINTADYTNPGKQKLEEMVMQKASNGGIVLMHTGVQDTLDALPVIVSELKRRGFRFVTIEEMAGMIESKGANENRILNK